MLRDGCRGQRRGDDFVARSDADRAQRQRDRVRAGADSDCVLRAACLGKLRLERLDLGAENEPAAGDHAIDRGADVGGVFAGR